MTQFVNLICRQCAAAVELMSESVATAIRDAAEAAKFSHSAVVGAIVGGGVMVGFAVYVLRSLRAVFGDSWPWTLAKAAGIGFVYSIAAVPAFSVILVWASLT